MVRSCSLLLALASLSVPAASAEHLYGIHWWGHHANQAVDPTPKTMLDLPQASAWCTETIITNSALWWGPSWFQDLYSQLPAWSVSVISRVDYNWGSVLPPPSSPDSPGWPDKVALQVVNPLRHGCRLWVIGNEPNLFGEGQGWPNNQISPEAYAQVYRNVRNAIRSKSQPSPEGEHLVLIAGPSPGGVIPGVRFMDGIEYLSRVIDAIPPDEIDGFALHNYGWNATDFRNGLEPQLNAIKNKGILNKPVWLTEFNRVTSSNTDEQSTANFIRNVFASVNEWNQGYGNLNIVGMTWFVYDYNQQAGNGWKEYALEYWKDNGFPAGDSRDAVTAFAQAVDQRYPAGVYGIRRKPGDSNLDQRVDLDDYFDLADAFRTEPGHPAWNAYCDFDGNFRIDLDDYFVLAENFRT